MKRLLKSKVLQAGRGVAAMCKMMEDMRNETAKQASQEKAKEKAIAI